MASGTRSGRNNKDEDTSSSKSRSAGLKAKDAKGSNTAGTNSSRSRITYGDKEDAKSSTTPGSVATDAYNLRSSSRKAVDENVMASTPSVQKSEKLVKNLTSPSDNTKSERAGQERPANVLRRSERLEKSGASSSSGSKISSNSLSSPDGNKKVKETRHAKVGTVGREHTSDTKLDIKSSKPLTSKKLLTARSYRALLRSGKKKTKSSDASLVLNDKDNVSEHTEVESGVNDDAEAVWDNALPQDGCTGIGRRDISEQHFHADGKVDAEGSTSGYDHSFECENREMIHSGRKRKASKIADEQNCAPVKHQDNPLQSSPMQVNVKHNSEVDPQHNVDVTNSSEVQRLLMKDLVTSEFLESNLKEKFLAVDADVESCADSEGSKRAKLEEELVSHVPMSSLKNEKIVQRSSLTEANVSPPCMQKVMDIDHCRINNVSQSQEQSSLSAAVRLDSPVSSKPGSTGVRESLLTAQRETRPNACVICKEPGLLLCCDGKGCKVSYHFSCLDPPLPSAPLGAWLCPLCLKKKLESGVYAISEGPESVWDVKEGKYISVMAMLTFKGERLYFVKFKGLAHAHNCWIPEGQLLVEAPMLIAKFNRRNQKGKLIRWRKEWTEPQRFLQKRMLLPVEVVDQSSHGHGDNAINCLYEWFVKWKGLGYEHATWELENSPFLCSAEAMVLKDNYDSHHEEAKKASDPSRADKALFVKQLPFHKLSKLPHEISSGLDNDHLKAINQLREFWHKSHNALFIDDQERILKSILFILAILPNCNRPFIIVSPVSSLSFWETEFIQLAPSINLVVYSGKKDVRKMIQTLEFYGSDGCVMFQVLLSHYDAVIEDFDTLESIHWEAIIVDECQNSRVSKHLVQLKNLSSDFRLLLSNCSLKDNIVEHLNLLSFLDSGGKVNCTNSLNLDSRDSVGTLALSRERLTQYLAYERKSDSSKFVEFWVPVQLSNVQLEQYCSILFANSTVLRSCWKNDQVGALRDVLISTRKCCDHPYVVEPLLQVSLTKGLEVGEILDIGVKASGKLQLLDKILQEIKNQGLRVLVLFQSIGGAGRNSIGDILDDFLHQRFGANSYERLDGGLMMSKKQAFLSMFNDKTKGRFVFLLDIRACLPSVNLLSVDAVIIYNSDWNPHNDLRALQRISVQSHYEPIKVFRLFSSFTVEEKVLAFSKQDTVLESDIQNISTSLSHSLLGWGASYQFSKLDDFHRHDNSGNQFDTSGADVFMEGMVVEILAQLSRRVGHSSTTDHSILIKAPLSGGSYSRNIILVGEQEKNSWVDKDVCAFWSSLLEGRNPRWRYLFEPSERSRRKAQNVEALPEADTEEVKKKRRKIINTSEQNPPAEGLGDDGKNSAGNGASLPVKVAHSCKFSKPDAPIHNSNLESQSLPLSAGPIHNVEREKLRNSQRGLHLLLKPEILKLCEILRLPEDVKCMADKFLEHVMNNHVVTRDPETLLQALKIAICWRAASFLKHDVDRRESLALSKKYLNFQCSYDMAYYVYTKLRMLKKKFSCQNVLSMNDVNANSADNQSSSPIKDVHGSLKIIKDSLTSQSEGQIFKGGKIPDCRRYSENVNTVNLEMPDSVIPGRLSLDIGASNDVLVENQLDLLDEVSLEREAGFSSREQCAETFAVRPNKGGEYTLVETESHASQSKNIVADPPALSAEASIDLQTLSTQQEACNIPMVTETPFSQPCTTYPLSSAPDEFPVGSGIASSVDNELLGGNISDSPCLISLPQDHQNIISSGDVSRFRSENSLSSDQVASLEENQRSMESVGAYNNQELETVVPVVHSVDSLTPVVQPACLDSVVSTHFQPLLSTSTDVGMVSTHTPTVSEGEPDNQRGPPAQRTEDPPQRPLVSISMQEGQLNQVISQSMASTAPNTNVMLETSPSGLVVGAHVQPAEGRLLPQSVSVGTWLPPQLIHPDPLENELIRIRRQEEILSKMHEDMKLQVKLELEQEIEKVRMRYNKIIQDADKDFIQRKESLQSIYKKVLLNKTLAEEFRARFIDRGVSSTSQAPRPSPVRQLVQVSELQHGQRLVAATPTPVVLNPATLHPTLASSSLPAARHLAPSSDYISSLSTQVRDTSTVLPAPRHPYFSPIPPARTNSLHTGGETRAPAPHLQRSRPQMPLPALHTHIMSNHQQQLTNLASIPSSTTLVPSMVAHAYPSRPPARVISHPEPQDSRNATLLPNLPQSYRSEFGRWVTSSQPRTDNDCSPFPSMDAGRAASGAAAIDAVVCISDDDG